MTTQTLHWLAGLLEGEGSFTRSSQQKGLARIEFTSVDFDIAMRVSEIFNCPITIRHASTHTRQQAYQVRLARRGEAIGWMLTLYSLMGRRRRERIRELIAEWKDCPTIVRRGLETKLPK